MTIVDSSTLRDAVVSGVRNRCAAMHGVSAAYVSHDGTGFLMTGPEWSVELSSGAAGLAVDLQDRCAPNGPYIDGGFVENVDQREMSWDRIYP